MTAVSAETGQIELSTRRPVGEVSKGYVRFMEGDVIFAKITPCMENGKVAPVTGLPSGYAAGSTEFHVFRPKAVEQRYLWYWLVSRAFRRRAQRKMSGSAGQLRVPVDYLREAVFPLAPIAEQRRIVARIGELFAEIEAGEAALNEARKGLDTFRRALLKAAVTGELTKDWRQKNINRNKRTETGHDLLARIRAEREATAPAKGRTRRARRGSGRLRAPAPIRPESGLRGAPRSPRPRRRAGVNVARAHSKFHPQLTLPQTQSGAESKSMNARNLVAKVWNFAHVLRDQGVSYQAYISQISYLLFLKMDEERVTQIGEASMLPEGAR